MSVYHALAAGGAVRLLIVEASEVANDTRRVHGLGPNAARLAAEGIVATGLLASTIKGEERVTLQVQAEVPRISFAADMNAEGGLRARLRPSSLPPVHAFDGAMLVIKSDARRELYRGTTAVSGQSLGAALATHLGSSNQVHGYLSIDVTQDEQGEIDFAGGVWVERLPQHATQATLEPDAFDAIFGPVACTPATVLFEELHKNHLLGHAITPLHSSGLFWSCTCNRERVRAMLQGLGEAPLREMIEEDDGAEVTCHFCMTAQRFTGEELRALLPQR